MRIGLKIKSTFRLHNTAMTTQKALFTCLFQPPDTPFLTTPLLKTNWVQDPRHASAVCKNHVPNVLSSQPLHSDPLPQCPVSQPGNQSLYQIMQITSSHPHLSVFHLYGCSKLPTVTSYCRNESRTSRDIPSMHRSPDTPAQPCNSDPTLAIRHAMTQTPTRILPRPHGRFPKTTYL